MIRLLTVIGHGTNLLPHFIKHYQKHVDEINIIVYESEIAPNIKSEVQTIISDYENVKIVFTVKDRIFDWEKVTKTYNFISTRNLNDWFVIADIDEFHLYPNDDLRGLIRECNNNGYDIVRGGFIDRIGDDGGFPKILDDVSIWKQFPNAGFFRYPMSGANPNKICVKKGWVILTNGQHYANIEDHTTWRWQGWNHPLIDPINTVQVHHFKWDETSIERIKAVADVKKDYAYSTEYELMYNSLRRTKFKINLTEEKFSFELGLTQPEFKRYRNWNKLIKIIKSI
jgi:hypothetical protein